MREMLVYYGVLFSVDEKLL